MVLRHWVIKTSCTNTIQSLNSRFKGDIKCNTPSVSSLVSPYPEEGLHYSFLLTLRIQFCRSKSWMLSAACRLPNQRWVLPGNWSGQACPTWHEKGGKVDSGASTWIIQEKRWLGNIKMSQRWHPAEGKWRGVWQVTCAPQAALSTQTGPCLQP